MDKRPNKVSVLVLTMNEEVNIHLCLEGVKWADEIFVLDSGSTDKTLEICREYTDKIFSRKFDNWSSQLNWALDNLPFRNEWLLNVDADEIVPDNLAAEIIQAVEHAPDDVTAYWLRRRFMFLGRWLRYSALYKTWILRMFRHKRLRFQRLVNPVPVYKGGNGYFTCDLIHDDRKGFSALVARHNSYSTYEAMESFRRLYPDHITEAERALTLQDYSAVKKKKRIFERLPLFARPPIRFAYMYFLSMGFLDGVPGFIYSFFKLCYEFFICVKIYELKLERLFPKEAPVAPGEKGELMLSVVESFKTGKLELAEIPAPIVRPGFVLVANRASLISAGTERAAIDLAQKSLAGKAMARPDLVRQVIAKVRRDGLAATIATVRAKLDSPLPLGYSSAGVVLEVGKGVDEFAPGDRVACAGAKYATHSDVVCVPKNLCVKVPDGVAFEEAAYVTLGSIAMHGVRQADLALGETVCVIGCGLLGLITIQILAASGVKVFATDLSAARLALAADLGASAIAASSDAGLSAAAQEFTRGAGFDAVVITAAAKSDAPMRLAEAIARDRGKVVVVGDVGMNIRRRPFYEKELTLIMSRSYGPGRYDPSYEEHGVEYPLSYVRWGERRNFSEFLSLIDAGKVSVKSLTTHSFPIHEALAAYDLVLGKVQAPFIGIVLKYPETPSLSRRVELKPSAAPKPEGHVGVAFVGAGGFAQSVLLPAMARVPGVEPIAIVSAGGLSAEHAGNKFGFNYATSDFAEALKDPAINACVIATRHNLHSSQVAAALAAGRHVYVEKPLALDAAGLEEVRRAFVAANRTLMVGFNRRWSPHAAAAKGLFAGTKRPISINYRVNAGVVPQSSWVQDPSEGGGRVLGEVCHFVDLAAFLTDSAPKSVYAARCGGTGALEEDADTLAVTVVFANGSVAAIVYTSAGEPSFSKERVEVAAAGKTAVIEDFRRTTLYADGRSRVIKTAQDKGHNAEMVAFFEAITSGRPPVSFADLYMITTATFAIEQSLGTGKPVVLDEFK